MLLLVSTNLSSQQVIIPPPPNALSEKFTELCKGYVLVRIDKSNFSELRAKSNEVKENKVRRLCLALKHFARINERTNNNENKHGTWTYRISYNSDESIITVIGNQATGLPRYKKYIYKLKTPRLLTENAKNEYILHSHDQFIIITKHSFL